MGVHIKSLLITRAIVIESLVLSSPALVVIACYRSPSISPTVRTSLLDGILFGDL